MAGGKCGFEYEWDKELSIHLLGMEHHPKDVNIAGYDIQAHLMDNSEYIKVLDTYRRLLLPNHCSLWGEPVDKEFYEKAILLREAAVEEEEWCS